MKGRQWKKQIIAGTAAACLGLGSLQGLSVQAEETDGVAMGRYLESEVALPEDLYVQDVVGLPDGRLRIAGQRVDESLSLWDSSDGGGTWELAASLPEEYAEYYFQELALDSEGGGAGIYMKMMSEDDASPEDGEEEETEFAGLDAYELWYCTFDAEGNAQMTLLPDEDMFYIRIAQDGTLIGTSYGGEITVRNRENAEVISTLPSTDVCITGTFGQEVFGITDSDVLRYDIGTGEPLARDEALNEALFADGANYYIISSSTYPIVFAQDGERLYYATDKGIFSHVMGGSVVEQIVDGSLNSLSDPSVGIAKMAVLDQAFYIAYMGTQQAGLLKYEYSDEVAAAPQRELTVYSLEENDVVRQMAVLFQKEYPDTYVNYEVGMTGEDGITASDALRTLNTEILAGNGPDILVMDNMSVETYAEKGILTDLSDILAEIEESGGLFENIAYTYRDGGQVLAVPALFGIPVAVGCGEYGDRAGDMSSLAELAGETGVLYAGTVAALPDILYPVCAGGWKNEDNTIDQDKLTEYVSSIRQIYENYQAGASDTELEQLGYMNESLSLSYTGGIGFYDVNVTMGDMELLSGDCEVVLGNLTSVDSYAQLTSVALRKEDVRISLLDGLQTDVFLPYCVFGILNTGKEQERASDFVKLMLGETGQMQQYAAGFPVNRSAFEQALTRQEYGEDTGMSFSTGNADGTGWVELDVYWPSQEQADSLRAMAEQLSVCAQTESVQKDAILEQTRSCMTGEISVEEAVNAIMQKINLYLAE